MKSKQTDREFWIHQSEPLPLIVTDLNPGKYAHQYIYVREVNPAKDALYEKMLNAIKEIVKDSGCDEYESEYLRLLVSKAEELKGE